MVQVTVKVYSILREMVGKPTLMVKVPDNSSVKDVLNKVIYQFKDSFDQRYRRVEEDRELLEYFIILINNMHISNLDGLESKVRDGDMVEIMEPISGG